MPRLLFALASLMALTSGCCTPEPSSGAEWFQEQRWVHRLLVYTEDGAEAARQRDLLAGADEDLIDRDLLVIQLDSSESLELVSGGADLPDPELFRERYGLPEGSFEVVLVGLDGGVKERRQSAMSGEELWGLIDAMPMRRDELRQRD